MKKKVAIISDTAGAGVGRYIIDILENLDRERFEPYLIYPPLRTDALFEKKAQAMEEKGVEIYNVDMKMEMGISDYLRALREIIKVLRKIKPDVVHCNSFAAGVLGSIAAKAVFCKMIVYTPHSYEFQDRQMKKGKRDMYIWAEKMISSLCDVVINVSEDERDEAVYEGAVKIGKTRVILNGIDVSRFEKRDRKWLSEEFGIGDAPLVGYVAKASRQKDPVSFVRVAAKIVQAMGERPVQFVYVGDGELFDDAVFEAKMLDIEDKIVFTGFRMDVERIIPCFDVFISTSIYEGLPYNILEAMAARVPVVATDVTGSRQILSEGCGVLVPVGDHEGMADWTAGIIGDERLAVGLSQCAYERVKDGYSIEHMVRETEKIYLKR